MERKLTAILSADVKGYSRLMGEDEEATIRTLTAYRAVMATYIQQQRGRVVDSPGDNLLAEFASVVDAVRCAVALQYELKTRNATLPAQRRMEFRIGLNLGDVVIEGERLYGDGVNIAARVEGLAEPGGLCISGTVYDQIETKLPLHYDYLGEQTVKNIAKPVRVWRVVMDEAAAALATQAGLRSRDSVQDRQAQKRPVRAAYQTWAVVVIAGLVLIGGGSVAVRYLARSPFNTQSSILSPEAAPAALPLSDKPSIIVLPFVNMSEDSKQDYFSDGITEDLTTALSQIASLFVIARSSAFTYKGKAVRVQDVGRELGVQYVLEGSVRRADDQVRITVQLVDAPTDSHLWAERYDRSLKDIFALQDEIVQKIVTTLKLQLTLREQGVLVRKTTDNLEAYDTYLRGLESFNHATQEANAQARQLFEKAMRLNPRYPYDYLAQLGMAYRLAGWYEEAIAALQNATIRNPKFPSPHLHLAVSYSELGRDAEARAEVAELRRLSPTYSLEGVRRVMPFKDPVELERYLAALRKAGLK